MKLPEHLARQDWAGIHQQLHRRGYAVVPGFLNPAWCERLRALYAQDALYRKTVVMARYRFGLGEYRYFADPLPGIIQSLREGLYPYLVPVANAWAEQLGLDVRYPSTLAELRAQCAAAGQHLPTPLILQYGPGGYNTLHQDLYGQVHFPLQAVFMLSQPGEDYSGGEFVMTEQVPRAQSRPIVLKPERGDMVVFTTNYRPERGTRGHYRVSMKHGVAEVSQGQRMALGVIFHNAQT